MSRAAALALSALLAGCAVGPNYRAPSMAELKAPAAFAAQPAAARNVDIGRWWQAFGDPTLTGLVEQGLAANLDIDQAGARVRQARAELKVARAALVPSLDASVSASRRIGGGRSATSRSAYDAGFDAAYELDLFDADRRAVEAAHASAQGAEASLRSAQLTVAAEIALNYLDAREAQARLAIAQATLKDLDEVVDIVGWRLKAGLVSELDLEQARQLRAQTTASIPTLQTTYAAAANRLAVLTGEAPGAVDALLQPPANPPTAPAVVPAAVPADVIRRRPDVALAERTLAAETARIGVAEARLYPTVGLSGSFGGSGASLAKLADNAVGSLLAAISAPLFHGGTLRAGVEAQRAVAVAALDSYKSTVLMALEESENAFVAVDAAARREASLAQAEQAARSAAEIARIRYRAGQIDFQSLLDTERTLLTSQDSLVSAHVARGTAATQLFKALGGGWQAAPAPPSLTSASVPAR